VNPSNPNGPNAGDARRWRGIDHVQLAIPPGGEDVARRFFVDRLGFTEIAKPPAMAARGGAWFVAGETQLHVGVDASFVPARRAHPALLVGGLRDLIAAAGLDATWPQEIDWIEGPDRCHVDDPFGNRIELIEAERSEGEGEA
jgi:catechol 2,3-dioxygenase-like lactoylglutathione lyase family enzyme